MSSVHLPSIISAKAAGICFFLASQKCSFLLSFASWFGLPAMSETDFHRCQEAHLLFQGLIPGSSSVSGDGQEAISPSGALLGVPGVGRAEMYAKML